MTSETHTALTPASRSSSSTLRSPSSSRQIVAAIVLAFVEKHPADIVRIAGYSSAPAELVAATKLLIAEQRALSPQYEMRAQCRALESFARRHSAATGDTRASLELAWIDRNSAAWRRRLLRRYQHVTGQLAEPICERLRATLRAKSA